MEIVLHPPKEGPVYSNMLVLHPRNKLLCIWIQIALDLENKYIRKKERKKKGKFIIVGCGFSEAFSLVLYVKKYLRKIQKTGLQLYLTPKTSGRERM